MPDNKILEARIDELMPKASAECIQRHKFTRLEETLVSVAAAKVKNDWLEDGGITESKLRYSDASYEFGMDIFGTIFQYACLLEFLLKRCDECGFGYNRAIRCGYWCMYADAETFMLDGLVKYGLVSNTQYHAEVKYDIFKNGCQPDKRDFICTLESGVVYQLYSLTEKGKELLEEHRKIKGEQK